ncbi:maleylpyruvate isomerase family mycothiol-dependent enzyme [Ornithinimicrobium sp. F0845]|uniref:maleylpyruvate isomerase family mycothiol-dependent enzyme n=1 Tax=Ornithinimicrobium sp. F0845 TaxID=2926412 RepID=UPI001FF1E649|nr:maleylpyruvate isomerase family mycothiol-dependent enzyme [Ornithinimicrobium sp. F0845]MCK0112159.1 maleylpyruvate isomerase family mycothiol-dependent enzyme [Ornithinimicrobium sp. F0845]
MDDIWPIVHTERAALIADLEGLDDAQWEQPSLCEGWTVHDVAAHLVDTALATRLGFLLGLARARFDFDRQNARGVERHRGASPRHTLERLRDVAHRTSTPPGSPASRIVEEVVHGEDIRRPLGLVRDYPREAVERALRYQVGTSAAMGGARDRVDGLLLEATDADLTIGAGDVVRGRQLDLLLVVSGRRSALPVLSGPGVAALSQRP